MALTSINKLRALVKISEVLAKAFLKVFFAGGGCGDWWVFPQLSKSRSYTFQWKLNFYPEIKWVN